MRGLGLLVSPLIHVLGPLVARTRLCQYAIASVSDVLCCVGPSMEIAMVCLSNFSPPQRAVPFESDGTANVLSRGHSHMLDGF